LLREFARRAFRRPVTEEQLQPFLSLVHAMLDQGESFTTALRGGYRAMLCSPRFLYFHEQPGQLDHYAIANRLSYLLWNSMPDEQLFQLAREGRLKDPQVLRQQVERMLSARGEMRFVSDFAAEWLDLRLIDFTEPDRRMYPDFDIVVQQSMLDETRNFLERMLRENLSATHLIDSTFTYLNSRLARYYQVPGVDGDKLRVCELGPTSNRGGLLTQGAILKVTANGTTTSPVVRGVWISERLLGKEIPPPPAGVPAIEPDIRGAKTIREMLAKHRSDQACAACHAKIDPPGFALEKFDPAGQWRESYPRFEGRRRVRGTPIESGYSMANGRRFDNLAEFRQLLAADPHGLARNLAEKLLVYGTGAPIALTDRKHVATIVQQAESTNFGLRSVLHAIVTNPIFLNK
jgi:hypothetical protein